MWTTRWPSPRSLSTKNRRWWCTPRPCRHRTANSPFSSARGFTILKRAQLLGEVTRTSDAVCVAGTHGKTTVSSMIAHLLKQSKIDCSAFLGGVLKNYDSNLLLSDTSPITVVEADEYDRSFHWLNPWIAIITSADPDHLDIYGTAEAYRESFEKFTSLIRSDGHLLLKSGAPVTPRVGRGVKVWSYSESEGDYHAENIRVGHGEVVLDFVSPKGRIRDVSLGVPVRINVEKWGWWLWPRRSYVGFPPTRLVRPCGRLKGPERRFDIRIKSDRLVFIDDYAHHPNELSAAIRSIQALYPDKKLTAIFQPHLYSRTRDFADQFAESLSLPDEVILLDIYPAREEPIAGVSSEIVFNKIRSARKMLCGKGGTAGLASRCARGGAGDFRGWRYQRDVARY